MAKSKKNPTVAAPVGNMPDAGPGKARAMDRLFGRQKALRGKFTAEAAKIVTTARPVRDLMNRAAIDDTTPPARTQAAAKSSGWSPGARRSPAEGRTGRATTAG